MTLPISPYLQSYLQVADKLPDQLPDIPEAVVQNIQERIRKLVQLVAVRDEELRKLEMSEHLLSARLATEAVK